MNGKRGYPMPQGGGGYNPYSKYPDISGIAQQFMQNMMQMQQMRQQQAQQEWQREMTGKQFDLQKLKANIELQEVSRKRRGEELEGKQRLRDIEDIDKAVEDKVITSQQAFILKKTGRMPSSIQPTKPTAFEQKKAHWDKQLATKAATQEQYDEAVWGVKPKPTPEETIKKGATVRQANATWLKDVYKNADERTILKEAKKAKARPVVRGIKFDMPYSYNLAVLNQQDRVATPEDMGIIQKYDQMFKFFQDGLMAKGVTKFNDFMGLPIAKDPDIDKGQIKKWYDIYKKY